MDESNYENEGGERERRLKALAQSLLRKRDEAVRHRAASGIEKIWRDAQAAFDGVDEINTDKSVTDYASGAAYYGRNKGPIRSRVSVNVIRGKCETAEGRFADIEMPIDDRPWGLKVTPVPEVMQGLTDSNPLPNSQTGQPNLDGQGNPVRVKDVARQIMEAAKKKMEAMERKIEDNLIECDYLTEWRKALRQSTRLGTGVLKGPFTVKKIRKSWKQQADANVSVQIMEEVEDYVPASRAVDIWNMYPDPECGEDTKKAAYMWEADQLLSRDVAALIGLPDYEQDELMKVLSEEPKRTRVIIDKHQKYSVTSDTVDMGKTYERWEYNGDIDRDDLAALGCECPGKISKAISACFVFINDRPVKVMLNPLDTGDMPYDFFQWSEIAGSPWGLGVATQAEWQSRVITSAWRATMDNAGDSAGAQFVVSRNVEPGDGDWANITRNKIWLASRETEDVNKVFAIFQPTNVQSQLQAIIEMALKFIDMETTLPMMFQGEKAEMPETLGATNVMVDANNVALRSRVKMWDDKITVPHIKRYYHWHMQYTDDESIKGDFEVDARGASVLMAQDQQAQSLEEVLSLRQDQELSGKIDWDKLLKQLFKLKRLDVLKEPEDMKEQPPQPQQDQQGQAALQAAQIRTQGELQKAQLNQQSDMAELQLKQQMAQEERDHQMAMKQMELQMKMMEFADKKGLELDKIKADLAKEASKQVLMRDLADKKTAQMTSPPVEPPQKAPAGEAFQQ